MSEWLGEDQWVALDSKGRVVMVNGQRVDPGPDIFGGLAGEDLIYPGRSR